MFLLELIAGMLRRLPSLCLSKALILHFFKIYIIAYFAGAGLFLLIVLWLLLAIRIGMLAHLVLHISKTFFHLSRGFIQRNNKMKY
jgi:hypothetical protein